MTDVPPPTPHMQDIQMMDAPPQTPLPIRRFAQPRPRLGGVVKNLAATYQIVRPIIDPAVRAVKDVVKDGIKRGIKRGADPVLDYRNRLVAWYIETLDSRDDSLTIKRFKPLPIPKHKRTNPYAARTNPLPVAYLKTLPAGEFAWTEEPLAYIGVAKHEAILRFVGDFKFAMLNDRWTEFPAMPSWVTIPEIPKEVVEEIHSLGKNVPLSVAMHNHMIWRRLEGGDEELSYMDACKTLLESIDTFFKVHKAVYEKEKRLAVLKAFNKHPYGPIKYPYEELGRDQLFAHRDLIVAVWFMQFLISQRRNFNRMFPVETAIAIIADMDAVHKDELAPSYIDWPGKTYKDCPGSYPEDAMDKLLFTTETYSDYVPARLWNHLHLTPNKKVKVSDYDLPHQLALKKNEIYYDLHGQARAKKSHLRKEGAQRAQKKHVSWIGPNVAWYHPSTNKPVPNQVRRSLSTLSTVVPAPTIAAEEPTSSTVVPAPTIAAEEEPIASTVVPAPTTAAEELITSTVVSVPTNAAEAPLSPELTASPEPASSIDATESSVLTPHTGDNAPMDHITLATERANEEALERVESSIHEAPRRKQPKKPWFEELDAFFEKDHLGPFGIGKTLKISREKSDELEIRQQLEDAATVHAEYEVSRIAAEKVRQQEEQRLRAEQERLRAEEELRLAASRRQAEEDEALAQTGALRAPHRDLIPELSPEWTDKTQHTLTARGNAELAKSPDGTPLQRKDFATVVPQNQWLNDEIVNATLQHLATFVNTKAGVKNSRVSTPKTQILNSFLGKNITDGRNLPTERALRRVGIKKDNFLDIQNILIPLCSGAHWTLVAIRPKHRQIYHFDSMTGRTNHRVVSKVQDWMKIVLGRDYIESEWTVDTLASPLQCNSDDCGVHTITNGICMALGLEPDSYSASMMPRQRLHLAAVLLNGGFQGEFSLDGL